MLGKQNLFGKRDEIAGIRDPRIAASVLPSAQAQGHATNPLNPASPTVASATAPGHAAPAVKPADGTATPASENRLIVGPDVKLRGAEILDCDTLVVEGRVEATMDSRVINIAKNGAFSGKVGIDVAEIHGSFEGELVARSQLIIHATGRVSGKIRYGKILIEAGGEVSGDVRSLAGEAESPAGTARVVAVDSMKPKVLATLS